MNGIDYKFIDEISILAYHKMYKISLQLAKVLNGFYTSSGGINIIFADHFALLPPIENSSLYSWTVEI